MAKKRKRVSKPEAKESPRKVQKSQPRQSAVDKFLLEQAIEMSKSEPTSSFLDLSTKEGETIDSQNFRRSTRTKTKSILAGKKSPSPSKSRSPSPILKNLAKKSKNEKNKPTKKAKRKSSLLNTPKLQTTLDKFFDSPNVSTKINSPSTKNLLDKYADVNNSTVLLTPPANPGQKNSMKNGNRKPSNLNKKSSDSNKYHYLDNLKLNQFIFGGSYGVLDLSQATVTNPGSDSKLSPPTFLSTGSRSKILKSETGIVAFFEKLDATNLSQKTENSESDQKNLLEILTKIRRYCIRS